MTNIAMDKVIFHNTCIMNYIILTDTAGTTAKSLNAFASTREEEMGKKYSGSTH